MTRRAALYLGFGAVIVAALGASYLHLAAWLAPWMPPGWGRMSYVAALSIDGLILAPIMARQIVGGPVPGLSLPLAQWLGVVMSIYVNTRWGIASHAGTIWADIGVGASILPVVALIAEHAMRSTLAARQDKEAQEAQPVRVPVAKRAPKTATPDAVAAAILAAPIPRRATVTQDAPSRADMARQLAAETGKSVRTAYRMLADGRRVTGGAV